jgi:hypothetical protein
MTWDDVLERLRRAELNPIEESYMEHYGKVVAAQQPRFRDRNFRCTCGVVRVDGVRIQALFFPSEGHRDEFLEVTGSAPWRFVHDNAVLEFEECDPEVVQRVMRALGTTIDD